MNSFFNNFLANRALFFDLFDKAAKNVVEMANLLTLLINSDNDDERELMVKQIDKMENTGDDITHKIYLCIDKIMFTPLNRDSIHQLASTIDDVADTIKEASCRIYLYNFIDFAPAVNEITAIILRASQEIEIAVNLLRTCKKPNQVLQICLQIKSYQRQSHQIYYHAVAGLFAEGKNAVSLIKLRDILLSLETSVNKCKNVSDVINVVLVNNL